MLDYRGLLAFRFLGLPLQRLSQLDRPSAGTAHSGQAWGRQTW